MRHVILIPNLDIDGFVESIADNDTTAVVLSVDVLTL